MERGMVRSPSEALMTETAGDVRIVWPLSCWGSFCWDGQTQNSGEGSTGGAGGTRGLWWNKVCMVNVSPLVGVSGLGRYPVKVARAQMMLTPAHQV